MPRNGKLLRDIADALDRRRRDISAIVMLVAREEGTTTEGVAAQMAIPMLYAHWEGFVHECLLLYLEFLEQEAVRPTHANPTIFAFSLKRQLKSLTGEHTTERVTTFVKSTLEMLSSPITFAEKVINTKSNLNYDVLQELCASLCVDVAAMSEKRRQIKNLVERRNHIAHGGRREVPKRVDIEHDAQFVLSIMQDFEAAMQQCLSTKAYLSA